MSGAEEPEILFEARGGLAVVTLNRPKALNTLTWDMMLAYHPRLREWAADPGIDALVIRATGSRAFCAGGDIRIIWEQIRDGGELPRLFFRREYALNYDIHRFPKPYIAFLDGIVMGGGVGLSVHGSHRIATENTIFAMPETGIGLFPDVGGTYFLPRLPGKLGLFLGLTGARLRAADCLYAGIATHYVESARLEDLVAALAGARLEGAAAVDAVIANFAADPGPAPLAEQSETIDRCFAAESVEAILEALRAEGAPWADKLVALMEKASPTGLKLAFRQIHEGAELDFAEAMTLEYRLSQACMYGHDFPEGVRALIIDKDNAPKWRPATLAEVEADAIDACFRPLGERDLVLA